MNKVDTSTMLYLVETITAGVLVSSIAILYSELLFSGTQYLYKKGKLQRYYPLPKSRYATTAWINTFSFTIPTAIYARYMQYDLQRSWSFNPIYMAGYMFLYMLIHDPFFYWCHRTFHISKTLYKHLHAMHHEYSYSMHVYLVGHAELVENFIQVGLPWMAWTAIAGHNWWYWAMPLWFVLYSTLIGHSGYRSNYWLLLFHPFAFPIAYLSGKWMLTTGDHQMHHSHRRVNFGLFWRFWDIKFGTYQKFPTRAEGVEFWQKWAANKDKEENSAQARKWLGKHQVEFHEIEWGF